MPRLSRIVIYPIKSLDGVEVARARLLPTGGLEYDRRFALVDRDGRFVNGKRTPALHSLRTAFEFESRTVRVRRHGRPTGDSFQLDAQRADFEAWVSDYLKSPVRLIENPSGFPDDTRATGPTLISTMTLHEVSAWYDDFAAATPAGVGPGGQGDGWGGFGPAAGGANDCNVEEMRRRFRVNLEIAGAEPFWEDRLFAESGTVVPFRIGDAQFVGVNPCRRCVVPTRSSESGEPTPRFAAVFERRRRETLPAWVNRAQFDTYYRLAVNTRLSNSNAATQIRVGNPVRLD